VSSRDENRSGYVLIGWLSVSPLSVELDSTTAGNTRRGPRSYRLLVLGVLIMGMVLTDMSALRSFNCMCCLFNFRKKRPKPVKRENWGVCIQACIHASLCVGQFVVLTCACIYMHVLGMWINFCVDVSLFVSQFVVRTYACIYTCIGCVDECTHLFKCVCKTIRSTCACIYVHVLWVWINVFFLVSLFASQFVRRTLLRMNVDVSVCLHAACMLFFWDSYVFMCVHVLHCFLYEAVLICRFLLASVV